MEQITNAFDETLKDSNLQTIGSDLTEVMIDSLLKDSILKDIPIVGTLVNIGKATLSIRDRMFLKKILFFLSQLKDVDAATRNSMIAEIDSSKEYHIKVGEKLLYIVEKSEDHIATLYIAKLFKAFLREKLSYSEFLRGSNIIQKIFIEDLIFFINRFVERTVGVEEPFTDIEINLMNVGVCASFADTVEVPGEFYDPEIPESDIFINGGGQTIIYLTTIGKKLRNVLRQK